jgi:hypothetical protein
MGLTIEDPETLALAEALAERFATSPERAIHLALLAMRLSRPAEAAGFAEDHPPPYRPEPRVLTEEEKAEGWRKLQALHERMKQYPRTGLVADKAFYDSLNDE